MKKLLTLALSVFVVAGCSAELGEEPEDTSEPLTKVCSYSAANRGGVIGGKPSCCYDADTCFVTANGSSSVIATFYEQWGPDVRLHSTGYYWSIAPSDLPENRSSACSCLSVASFSDYVPGPQYVDSCYVSGTITGAGASEARCYRPNVGERAFLIAGTNTYNCWYELHNDLPASYCN